MQRVDWQAAQQIEALFHAPDCHVWELLDAEPPTPEAGVLIQDEAGMPIAYAHPAPWP
jgi:hypothetical protein